MDPQERALNVTLMLSSTLMALYSQGPLIECSLKVVVSKGLIINEEPVSKHTPVQMRARNAGFTKYLTCKCKFLPHKLVEVERTIFYKLNLIKHTLTIYVISTST